ncbi:peptidoglycan DD-metalloendopeptidase family protein [uncultured Sphingomonas sp.]|uniref:murein hydrolase activator EnvC family protein n=1 Tax=uncultured Sphingomonas sp. TaxID=158754 RepID=UPI0025E692AB|nr:peptidoglycan DD-metalloendopeptidase family protein [uncultured Sphingomonas sp.]
MRRALVPIVVLAALAGATAWAQDDPVQSGRERLGAAKRAAVEAAARSKRLERAARAARVGADRTGAAQAALAARITAAEANRQAAQARVALIGELLARRRGDLAASQAPVARLVGALQSLATRPAWLAVAQPGSTDDLVHVRAVLGTVVPAMQQRTAVVRAGVADAARLRSQAGVALATLAASNARLENERLALLRAEAAQRLRSRALARGAMVESDRAIALGEQARDIVDRLEELGEARDTRVALAALAGPLPRPEGAPSPLPPPAYRLPVTGQVATGFGEISDSGVRARGLTLTVAPGATVIAPAPGRIAFSKRFRGYRRVVILDHGDGWTTTVTGLAASVGPVDGRVVAGTPIGRAPQGDAPTVTIELRRRGVPVDLAAIL